MGLSNYPGPTEGLLAMLVMGIVFVVAMLFNTATPPVPEDGRDSSPAEERSSASSAIRVRRFEQRCHHSGGGGRRAAAEECCVCLSRFEDEEEVSEVARCKHVFHKDCLERWFQNDRSNTCPLCRSLC